MDVPKHTIAFCVYDSDRGKSRHVVDQPGTYVGETEETVPSAEEQLSENLPGVGPQRNRPEPVELCASHLDDQSLATRAVLAMRCRLTPIQNGAKTIIMSPVENSESQQWPRRKHQQPHQNREGPLPWISE